MTCGNIEPPPSMVRDWGFNWINWLNEVFKRLYYGPCHGSMYQYELGTVITISVQSTYYPITSMTVGKLRGFSFASDTLTVNNGGRYLVTLECSYSDGGNTNFEIGVLVNGTVDLHSACHAATTGSLNNAAAGTGFIDLNEGDELQLAINNHSNTNNATIEHASITVLRVGAIE